MAANPQSAVLIRAAIRGDSDSLGALCVLYYPNVYKYSWQFLSKFRLESETEDLAAEIIYCMVKAFPRYDPVGGNFSAWVKRIASFMAVRYIKANPVLLRQVPLPEEDPEADEDYRENPLDGLSRECWERDHPEAPLSQSPRLGPKRQSSHRLKARERKAAPPPSRRGEKRKLSRYEKAGRTRRRNAFAEASP